MKKQINSSYMVFAEILFGVPQGSIPGTLLFKIFLCNLFLEISNRQFVNHTNDNIPHACLLNFRSTIAKPQNETENVFNCFLQRT